MTDNEIIKALEICAQNSVTRHNGLTYQGMPLRFLFEEILGFVNRQKAEIERLEADLKVKNQVLKDRELTPYPFTEGKADEDK